MNPDRSIRTVAVVGGGIVGLSAALAFVRALPRVRVEIVVTPADPAALADRLPSTLPPVGRFHAAIGLNELDLVRDGVATHRLATRFENWSASGRPWYHAFGDYGLSAAGVAFHQLWVRARGDGGVRPFHEFCAAAMLAQDGKFVHPSHEPDSPLSTFLYALRLDPERYRRRLTAEAERLRVTFSDGAIAEPERRQDGGVAALRLADGRRIEADLYIDCSGPSAALASHLGEEFEDWSECLPCDRLLLAVEPGDGLPSPCDLAIAAPSGWRWEAPLPDRRLAGFAYAGSITDEAAARREFGGEAAEAVEIRPGRRPQPWVANVLALGDAAIAVDPLEGTNLHLAQSAILRALELLPGRDCHALELREYNRRTEQETRRVRDFLALHYLRAGRTKGRFWRPMRERKVPDGLAHTLEQFEARGRLPFYEEETFDKHSWLAVLLGMGVIPRGVEPAAGAVDPAQAAAAMERLAGRIAAATQRLPGYRDYLANMARAPSR